MSDLDVSLPFTLTFNNILSQVEIVDHEKKEEIIFKVKDITQFEKNKRVIIEKKTNGLEDEIRLVTYKGENIILGLKYEINGNKSRILPLGKEQPRLFRDFPLIGSHGFDFPCVLNSKKFFPTEERDGLFLKDVENQKVLTNRKETVTLGGQVFEKKVGRVTGSYNWHHLLF